MTITLTEPERSYLYNQFTTLNQNFNLRELYNADVIVSVLDKLQSNVISFTPQESGVIQSFLTWTQEGLARLTDKRLQFILQQQNSSGFGAPGAGVMGPGGMSGGGTGDRNHFFNSGSQYYICLSIISKLNG